MHVLAALEDLLQHGLVGDVREHAQLDLRVVGARSARSRARPRSSRGSRGPAACGSGRSACSGWSRPAARWSRRPAGRWCGCATRASTSCGQHVEVGLGELVELAPALDLRDDLVLVADRLEHARVGRVAGLAAALARQAELVEEDLAELLGRADRELLARRAPRSRARARAISSRTRSAISASALGVELHARAAPCRAAPRTSGSSTSRQQRAAAPARRSARAASRPAPGRARRRAASGSSTSRGQPALLAQLGERVAAPGRVQQVGAEQRVVREVRRDVAAAPWRRARRPGVARARRPAPRAGVVARRPPPRPPRRAEAPRWSSANSSPSGARARARRSRPRPPAASAAMSASVPSRTRAPERRSATGRGRRGVGVAQRLLQPAQRVAQLELAEHLAQPRAVGLARDLGVEVDVHAAMSRWTIASCLEMRASSACSVRFSLRLAPEISSTWPSTSSSVAEALEQLGGRLVADPRDAGDVVGGVALQPVEVGDQLGRDAVAVDHRLAVVDLGLGDPARGGHDPHAPSRRRAGRRRGRR